MKSSVTPFQAVGLALAGYTFWVLADTSLKVLGASSLPAYEVIALVGFAEVALLLAVSCAWRGWLAWRSRRSPQRASQPGSPRMHPVLWPRNPVRQLLRSCLDLINNLCVVIALRHLPLALFYILIFLAPMVTALLATIFLREPLGWRRALAILAGFFGVLVAVNPLALNHAAGRGTGVWTGYLACLVCVACFSASMVWSRVMTQTESPESLTFFSGLVMAVAGSLAMLWHAQPVTAAQAAVLGCTGLFCVIGSFCFFLALKHTSAANVSQYHYSQLLTGALIAFLIWRERVTVAMVVGAALIVVAGAYTAAATYSIQRELTLLELGDEGAT